MYRHKELYTLDFRNMTHFSEFHQIIKDEFDFPDYYGRNWDAFWDCMTDMLSDPVNVEILGIDVVKNVCDDWADKLLEILKDFKHCYNDKFAHRIKIIVVNGSTRTVIE